MYLPQHLKITEEKSLISATRSVKQQVHGPWALGFSSRTPSPMPAKLMTPFRSVPRGCQCCPLAPVPVPPVPPARPRCVLSECQSHAGAVQRRATAVYSRVDRVQGALLLQLPLAFGVLGVSVAAAFPPLHCLPI